jgi:adenosylhomocysteine nucleosidase
LSALPAITVVCALPSEAQALIGHWRLALRRERPFRVYGDGPARVVVSGVGSHASAAAVGYAAGLADAGGDHMWLNLGIAGHVSHAVGTPLLAARITHHGREGAWYPSLLFPPPCATTELETHDVAVTDYPARACCDMEAAGFMAATGRVASGDLVQVLKVISDNADTGIANIERQRVHGLMQAALPTVLDLVEQLRTVVARLPVTASDSGAEALLARWHFTHAQALQLRQLLQRRALLTAQVTPDLSSLVACRDAATLLARLREEVDALPLPAARTR